MPEQGLATHRAKLEYLGPIGAAPATPGPLGQMLDTVDIWLAGTVQSLFTLIRR